MVVDDVVPASAVVAAAGVAVAGDVVVADTVLESLYILLTSIASGYLSNDFSIFQEVVQKSRKSPNFELW